MSQTVSANAFFEALRKNNAEREEFARLAIAAIPHLVSVMRQRTDQSHKVRALLYSLWNGHPTSLLDVVDLDWEVRKSLAPVILAFGYEVPKGTHFFYEAIATPLKEAGLFNWFCAAENEVSK